MQRLPSKGAAGRAAGTRMAHIPRAEERPSGATAGGLTAPGRNLDHYCETCFSPCQMTDRGALCEAHYGAWVTCEVCGLRDAAALHNGRYACGPCISEGHFE